MVRIGNRRVVTFVTALGITVGACGRSGLPAGSVATPATTPTGVSVTPTRALAAAPSPTNRAGFPSAIALPATPSPSAPTSAAPGSPTSPSTPSQSISPTSPAGVSAASPGPTQPAGGEAAKTGGEGKTTTEGAAAGSEGASTNPSVTDPGGLPPSPPTNDPTIIQMGEERYIPYRDPKGNYQVSFVSTWQVSPGPAPESVVARQGDRTIHVEITATGGNDALARARADAARLASASPGYQQLALRPAQIPYGSVVSLIYRFEQGTNAVTGKGKPYISGRVYVPRQNSPREYATVTVTAPAPFYGDFTQIFDHVVRSFRWR